MAVFDHKQTLENAKANQRTTSPGALALSTLIFLSVLGASAYFTLGMRSVDTEIATTQAAIDSYQRSIVELQTNRDIIALERVRDSVASIDKEIRASMAQKYLAELIRLGRKYTVFYTGFSFQAGKVTTAATVMSDSMFAMDPIVKVSKLIHDFREAGMPVVQAATGSVVPVTGSGLASVASDTFTLEPVGFIAGQANKRAFSLELSVR